MTAAATAVTSFLRRWLLKSGLAAAVLAVAACAAPGPQAGLSSGQAPRGAAPVSPSGPVRVALLAPLSGADGAVVEQARDIEAAARLAADSQPAGLIALQVIDTGADPARAAAAARQATEAGADVIIGPFFAQEAMAAALVMEQAGRMALSFTSFSGAVSSNVVALGYAPEAEVERILGYAAQQGLRSVAVVHAQSQYGDLVAQAARAAAPRTGVSITGTLSYPRNFQGVQDATAAGAPGLRAGGPQAALLADNAQGLESVAAFLNYHDLSPRTGVQYLGLGLWRESARSGSADLEGGWYADVDPAQAGAFATRFRAATGRTPTPLAALGYDAVAIVAALAQNGRRLDRAALSALPQAHGALGPVRIGSDGVARRGLAIMEMRRGGPQVREPAPTTLAPAS
jgi:ABC-type branched-subunit amino acid transport system substrate-binding protein